MYIYQYFMCICVSVFVQVRACVCVCVYTYMYTNHPHKLHSYTNIFMCTHVFTNTILNEDTSESIDSCMCV